MAYDPSGRKKIPAYPSVFGRGWQQPTGAQTLGILQKYQTPGTTASGLGIPQMFAPAQTQPPEFPARQADMMIGAAAPPAFPVQQRAAGGGAQLTDQMSTIEDRPDFSTTDRFEARKLARSVSRRSPQYDAARRFLRIDGSAPHSALDTMGTQNGSVESGNDTLRPPPVDFTDPSGDGPPSLGFGATAQDTARGIKENFVRAEGGAQWNKPMTYGDLRKKYAFQTPS